PLWPERSISDVPISHVTNGVHVPTWIAEPMRELLERYLGADFLDDARDAARWSAIDSIPDEELWAVRNELRSNLVTRVRERSVVERLSRGEAIDYVETAASTFNAGTLTIGFARRIASYKRLQLLVRDSARALSLLAGPRPI